MQRYSQSRAEMLAGIMQRRWARQQAKYWASGEQQAADLNARGMSVDVRTVQSWRQGNMPSTKHTQQLMTIGFKALLMNVYSAADGFDELSRLEAEIDQAEQTASALKREYATLSQAMDCKVSRLDR